MNKFLGKTIIFGVLLFFAFPTLAKSKIDVKYLSGRNLSEGKLFKIEAITPGWSQSKVIRIENGSSEDDVNLYINFDIEDGRTLAGALSVYVIEQGSGKYRVGGTGDRYDLKEAYKKGALFIDRLSAGKGKKYKIKIVFDEDAGNEYQGLSINFDMDFMIESEVADESAPQQILIDQGRTASFEISEEKEDLKINDTEESLVQGVSDSNVANGSGSHFSWWWLLLLLLLLLLAYYLWRKYKKYKEDKRLEILKNNQKSS